MLYTSTLNLTENYIETFRIYEKEIYHQFSIGLSIKLTDKTFLYFTILGAIQTAIFFSTFSFMPYEFDRLGVSSTEFSIWLAFTGLGYFSGNLINGNYASKIGISKMCFIG